MDKYTKQYAQFVTKEVVKASAAHIFDDLRATLAEFFRENPGADNRETAKRVMELLSDVECRYYNTFSLQEVFDEVLTR